MPGSIIQGRLINNMFCINIQDKETPLYRAAKNNQREAAELLLKEGANINLKNEV